MRKYFTLFLIVLVFAGCSLDYSAVYVTEDMSEDLPDSILYDFTHTSVKNGIPVFRLSAAEAYIYNQKDETQLTDILFQEFDDSGNIATEGQADKAVFYTKTEDAELQGNLYVYSAAEEASFSTPYLYWSDADKKLTGKENLEVLIHRDSGTEIRGTGFVAEARTRIVEFSGPVSGTYVFEDEEDDGETLVE
jgi:LPS export ABC transporter protein LptC